MNLSRTLLDWARPAWLALTGAILSGIAGGILGIAQAWWLSALIAAVAFEGADLAQASPWLLNLLAVFILRAGLVWAAETAGALGAVQIKGILRERLLAHFFQIGPAGMQSQQTGELAATAVQGVEALDAYYSQYLPQLVMAAVIPISIVAVALPVDPLSGLIFLLTGPLIPLFMILIGKAAEAVTRRQYSALGRMSAFFLDTLQGLTTLENAGCQRAAHRADRDRERQLPSKDDGGAAADFSIRAGVGAGGNDQHRRDRGTDRAAPAVQPDRVPAGLLYPGAGAGILPAAAPAGPALSRRSSRWGGGGENSPGDEESGWNEGFRGYR